MRGVEFRVGHNDHKAVERFLETGPQGVAGIVVDATKIGRHHLAIEAAHAAGIPVRVEPLTERLAVPGFDPGGLGYVDSYPIDPVTQLTRASDRDRLVDRVAGVQLDVADKVTPPHFFVDTNGTGNQIIDLNIDLSRRTARRLGGEPVRAILSVQREFLLKEADPALIAARYRDAGVSSIDLRITPLGNQGDGPVKVRTALQLVEKFRDAGLEVTFGNQGLLGEVAAALGLATAIWSGSACGSRSASRKAFGTRSGGLSGRRQRANGQTAARKRASTSPRQRRYSTSRWPRRCTRTKAIRQTCYAATQPAPHGWTLRLETQVGTTCARGLTAPSDSRASPAQWRPNLMRERLDASLAVRQGIDSHLPDSTYELKSNSWKSDR